MAFLDVCESFMAFSKISDEKDHVVEAFFKTNARKMSMLRLGIDFSKGSTARSSSNFGLHQGFTSCYNGFFFLDHNNESWYLY
jgi:hypothetical protein